MSEAYVLVGGGGHARSLADVIARFGGTVSAVVDPGSPTDWDVLVIAYYEQLPSSLLGDFGVLSVGDNCLRARLGAEVEASGRRLARVCARSATIAGSVADGAQVMEHAHVGPGADVACGAIVNTAATVEHHCVIGRYCHIAPGARVLGGASVGEGALIGSGAVIMPGVAVGRYAVVGAGAVVLHDVPAGWRALGVPASVRKTKTSEEVK